MRDAEHLLAWADFNRRIGSNVDFGIGHETFMVKVGQYKAVYNNMPVKPVGGCRQAASRILPKAVRSWVTVLMDLYGAERS